MYKPIVSAHGEKGKAMADVYGGITSKELLDRLIRDASPGEKEMIYRSYVVAKAIKELDLVEVVRCKDCIYRRHDSKRGYMCDMDSGDPYEQTRGVDDGEWYCADGERRKDVRESD